MNTNPDTLTISSTPAEQPGMDFNYLRQAGIRHLQQLAGQIWTDHNLHDPGITILDQLCYALMDLSYRIDYDIKDLLKEKEGSSWNSLFSPAQIMTTNPVTLLDFRKVIIDVKGVKNAWVEKMTRPDPAIFLYPEDKTLRLTNTSDSAEAIVLKGLYRILIEKKENTGWDVQPDVRNRLLASRNVGEDFAEIIVLESQSIALSGGIEVGNVEDLNEFVAQVLVQLAAFISPEIPFWSLQEMLAKGKTIDEIMDGPRLENGFIDDQDLIRFDRKKELHTSDIVRELMDIPGVTGVDNIVLSTVGLKEEWRLLLDTQKTPKLDPDECLESLVFTKNGMTLAINPTQVRDRYQAILESRRNAYRNTGELDIILAEGEYREPATYHSIQNQFPQVYGIGEAGLPESVSDQRTAQAAQLKAYLLFFDQLLANYFSQVEHMKDLFSFNTEASVTYFSGPVWDEVPGASEILHFEDFSEYRDWLGANTEDVASALERKNRFLNHLLARFSESFTNYSLLLYDYSNTTNAADLPAGKAGPKQKLVSDKLNFLRNYPAVSVGRNKAFNYAEPVWDTVNISGLEKRVAAKLGIPDRPLQKITELEDPSGEGFYMLEHILLRPIREDYNAYLDFLFSRRISAFEDVGNGEVRCFSAGHGLQNGERIIVNGTKSTREVKYDGEYVVKNVLQDTFVIQATYQSSVKNADIDAQKINPTWIRARVDTTFMILTRVITGMKANPDKTGTRCTSAAHGLATGDIIELTEAGGYNGKTIVSVIDENTFDIDKPYVASEVKQGRWMYLNQKKDPYSLQVTFVFPDWPERFKEENTNFRAFIEKTIREETLVHLAVYIRWLNREEMQRFEKAYSVFLEQLSKN